MTTYPTAAIREALLRAGCSLAMTDAAMVHLGTMEPDAEVRALRVVADAAQAHERDWGDRTSESYAALIAALRDAGRLP